MALALLLLGVVFNIAIGAFVLLRNTKSRLNRTLFLIALSLCAWIIANYLADKSHTHTLFWNRATFIGPITTLLFALQFFSNLIASKRITAFHALYSWVVSLIIIGFCFTDHVISGVGPRYLKGMIAGYDVSRGPAYWLVIAWIIILIFHLLSAVGRAYYRAQNATLKRQVRILIVGVISATVLGIITNALVPVISSQTTTAQFAPLASIAIMVAFSFAIIKHGLFDIRFFVVRALAYVTSLFLLTLLYIVPFILITAHYVHFHVSTLLLLTLTVTSLLLTVVYGFLRQAFDAFTNRLFLRGYYEPQEVLRQLSEVLVGTIQVEQLKEHSAKIIQTALRTRLLEYYLVDEGSAKAEKWLNELFADNASSKVIVVDELENQPRVVNDVRSSGIAVLVRLRATHKDLGVLGLGFKESGQSYNSQDRRLLGIAADEIAISLQNAIQFQEIQNFNITLQSRIDEATKQLRRTNAKLEALDETKDDFISMASHQLRTPLTSVKGYLSMVLDEDAGTINPVQRKMLNQAYISSQRMVYLIADLLNVSRLKTGKFVIESTSTNIGDLVKEEVSQLQETAKARSIEITTDIDKDVPPLQLDETKIRQVIMNFIDNAIYYNKEGGHIKVRVVNKPQTVELRVEDDGIGVPKEDQHHLFTKFYRAANARQARPDGTGLGLFMAKKVVAAQHGAILFESREGKGSTFGFTFSKAKLMSQPSSTS